MFSWKGKEITDLDSRKLSRNAPAYVILGLAVLAMTFFGVCSPSGRNSILPSGAAASVNGEDITVLQFKRAHIQRVQQAQRQHKGDFDAAKLGISQAVVNSLVDQEIYYQESIQNGIGASTAEVEDAIIEGKYFQNDNGKFDADLFKRYLRQQQYSEASFSEELKRSIANQKLRGFLTATYRNSKESAKLDKILSETKLNVEFVAVEPGKIPVSISDEEVAQFLKDGGEEKVKNYYTRNNKEYNRPETMRVRHALIAFKGAARATGEGLKRSKEDARALAEKVKAEAQAKPSDFESIVKKYTDEPSGKTKGGDLGYIKKDGDMVAPFSEAAFTLSKGQISEVVETKFGFHIIKAEDRKPKVSISLESAKAEIAKKLAAQEKRPELARATAEKLLAAVIAKQDTTELLKLNNLSWKETGDFALNARFLPGGLGADAKMRQAVLGLKEKGQVVENLIEANGNFYILQLKNRSEADATKIAAAPENPLDRQQAFEAFWTYNRLLNDVKKRYETEGRVFKNNEFVQYDAIIKSRQGSGS